MDSSPIFRLHARRAGWAASCLALLALAQAAFEPRWIQAQDVSAGAGADTDADAVPVEVRADAPPEVSPVPDPADGLPVATIEEVDEASRSVTQEIGSPGAVSAASEMAPGLTGESELPMAVGASHFRELMENSPFTRSLNLSDSLILTGVAHFDGRPVATLMNVETKETFVLSDVPNPQGWKMVELAQASDLETVTAKISVGGEVVMVRFDENRLKPGEARPGGGGGSGSSGSHGGSDMSDEERRKRMEEARQRWSSMTEEQQARMREIIQRKMQENPNMSRDERGQMYRDAMEEASSGGGRGGGDRGGSGRGGR